MSWRRSSGWLSWSCPHSRLPAKGHLAMICQSCEEWMTPIVNTDRRIVQCSMCGHQQAHRFLPLFIVTGPSGAGKTAIVPALQQLVPTWDVFETDILWDSGGDWNMTACNW